MKQRLAGAVGVLAVLVAAAGAGYAGMSWVAFDRLTRVAPGCGSTFDGAPRFEGNTPAAFRTEGVPDLDLAQYLMPTYQSVSLTSRDGTALAAWWVPGEQADSPAVVVVHPGFSCRRDPIALLPAGMLHYLGFGVLLPDLRNHGDSTVVDGRFSYGRREASDVLGAWDWLRRRGLPAERIGVLGMTSGGSAALIAAGEDPEIAAVWVDGPIAEASAAIAETSRQMGYPDWAVPGELALAGLFGLDPGHALPVEAVATLGARPLEVVASVSDPGTDPHHALDLMLARERACGECSGTGTWRVPNTQSGLAAWSVPASYETALGVFFGEALNFRGVIADPGSVHGPAGSWTTVDCAQWEGDPSTIDCSRWGDGDAVTLRIGMGETPTLTYEDAYNTYCATLGSSGSNWLAAGAGTYRNGTIEASLKGGCGTLGPKAQWVQLYYEIGNDMIWEDEDGDGWGYHFHRMK